jgi:hypothetical protein
MFLTYSSFSFCNKRRTVSVSKCQGQKTDQNLKNDKSDRLGVFFTNKSKLRIKKYLTKQGFDNFNSNFVCFENNPDNSTIFEYSALFGYAAAFRLKGMIVINDDLLVGVGRLATAAGEIKVGNFIPSMPMLKNLTNDTNNIDKINNNNIDRKTIQLLIDLPHRIPLNKLNNDISWNEELPACIINNINYPPIKIKYIAFPFDKQIIVDGSICLESLCDNEDGNCVFDPKSFEEAVLLHHEEEKKIENEKNINANNNKNIKNNKTKEEEKQTKLVGEKNKKVKENVKEKGEDDEKECSVCKYIKKGPCKEDFIIWNQCMVDNEHLEVEGYKVKCLKEITKLIYCYRKYEYYDIFMAFDFEEFEKNLKNNESSLTIDADENSKTKNVEK